MDVDCLTCANLKCYRGTCDRYGVPQEPDDYECGYDDITEDEIERFFSNGEKWDASIEGAGCSGYVEQSYDPYIDDYDNRW